MAQRRLAADQGLDTAWGIQLINWYSETYYIRFRQLA